MSETSGIFAAASELGIDVNSLDEGSDFDVETESTEAEGDNTEEVVNQEDEISDEDDSEEVATEGEETEEVQEVPTEEVPIEEPKLTAKEFQELQNARTELEKAQQAFKEERLQWEKEFLETHQEKLKAHDELDAFLADYAANNPDEFEIFKSDFQKFQRQYSNPVIDSLKTQLDTISKELGQFKAKASDQVTIAKLDAEMHQFKTTIGKEAEAAGLKVDYSKVEEMWAENPKMTLEQCFYALHGSNYAKAIQSKAKVSQVEKKVQARPTVVTAGSVKSTNTPAGNNVPSNTFDAVRYFARQLTGKS